MGLAGTEAVCQHVLPQFLSLNFLIFLSFPLSYCATSFCKRLVPSACGLPLWRFILSSSSFIHIPCNLRRFSAVEVIDTKYKIQLSVKAQQKLLYYVLYNCNANIYRVSQEERTKVRESVPYVKLYRYNPKHLYPKLNGYGDNGQRSLKL